MNKEVSRLRRGKGFTLVEVLIGILVAALGIVGVVQMQKHFIKAGNESNAHLIAMQLAKEQFENIKNTDNFTTITAGADGATIASNNYTFTRSWTVTNRYFDTDNGVWADTGNGDPIDAKNVTVTVSWTDRDGDTQSVVQTEVVSKISLHDSVSGTNTTGVKTPPQVPFTALNSIENPPITLVDDNMTFDGDVQSKETSKPVPTVDAHDNNNLIQFETVTYDSSTNKQTLEDYATVNCSCKFNGTGEGKTPTILRISSTDEALENDEDSGKMVTKVVGTVDGSSDFSLCTKCCRDHHDTALSANKYVPGTTDVQGDHPHYRNGNFVSAVTGGAYDEACRFRRVDGFYELVPDWVLVDMLVMEKSFFYDQDNVDAYTSYVKSVVKATLTNSSLPSKTDVDTILGDNRAVDQHASGTHQLIARGIYVDTASLSAADLATVQGYTSTKANWLEYIPFYEINLSLFANWSSSNTSVATVTTEPIDTIVDETNYYGTYSRGWMTIESGAAEGDIASIIASANTDNTGITGTGAIKAVTPLSDSVTVTVAAGNSDPLTGDKSILLEVNCVKIKQNGEIVSCSGQDGSTLTVTNSMNIECSYSSPNVTCNSVPDAANGYIFLSQTGFKFGISNDALTTQQNVDNATASELSVPVSMLLVDPQFSAKIIMVKQ